MSVYTKKNSNYTVQLYLKMIKFGFELLENLNLSIAIWKKY